MTLRDFSVERVVVDTETLRVEALSHGVSRMVLARPDVRNAFDEVMIREIREGLETLTAFPPSEVRVLLLEGEGKVFSAGADLSYMKRLAAKNEADNFEDARSLGRLFFQLANFPAPVIAVVQGAAIGGGLGLSVCADAVVAEDSAVFATSEVLLGIVPGVISPYIVRKIGLAAAAPFMLTGRRLSASEACELGLVSKIVKPEDRDEEVRTMLLEFLSAAPEAQRRTKELLKAAYPLPSEELIDVTAEHIARARCSPEGRDGLRAFFDKEAPSWAQEARRLAERLDSLDATRNRRSEP